MSRTVRLAFLGIVLVMAAHEAEHVAQVLQKGGFDNSCPRDCRGALGFIFDVEWVHFAYNTSIFVAIGALAWLLRPRLFDPLMLAVGVQGYHVVEHAVKIVQWLGNGHTSPTPGVAGAHLSLIELHFAINTIVFVLVLAAFLIRSPRARLLPATAVVALLAAPIPVAWATRTPTVKLAAGVHQGPLVLDHRQKLIGEPGTIVRGGLRVTADGVIVRGVRVEGGRNGIEVVAARGVVLDDVHVRGALLDGIHARRASVTITDCSVKGMRSQYAQGIDLSFGFDLAPSRVERCTIVGGQEGIVANSVKADVLRNHVARTTLRAITINEMGMANVKRNTVEGAIGVGILCIDYAMCEITDNVVRGTRRDPHSDNGTRAGYAIQSHFGSTAHVGDNRLQGNERDLGAFAEGKFRSA